MTGSVDRGKTGRMPRTPRLADESYLDFVQTFRRTVAFAKRPEAHEVQERYLADRLNGREASELDLPEIKSTLNKLPYTRVWQRFMRSHQEMFWRRARETFALITDEHLKELDTYDKRGPGKLVYDPSFVPPDYTRREIHLQPGGYTDDVIGGIVHHYGTKVFYSGRNDQNELHEEIAASTLLPDDGEVGRVLDVGCSLGQATLGLKAKFPQAEVWGLDVSLPMVRYAHKLAVDEGTDVNFVQTLAENSGFPDNHFDVVLSYILFHEVPFEKTKLIMHELFRIVRPGGRITILEFPNADENLSASRRFIIDYDSRNNCEPYSPGLVYSDFHGAIRDAGFEISPGPENSNTFLQSLSVTKPKS